MYLFSQRIALLGLALVPALMLFWLLWSDASAEMIGSAAPFAVISSVLAAVAVWIYGTFPSDGNLFASDTPERPARILRASAFRNLPVDLPNEKQMRHAVALALSAPATQTVNPHLAREPDHPELVLQQALGQVMDVWGTPHLNDLDRTQVTELYLLHELMLSDPADAGSMANLFLKPDQVLMIHEQVAFLRTQRSIFDAQLKTFEATMALWNDQVARKRQHLDLVTSLKALDQPDIDLWHAIVLGHIPSRPEHRDAALWIALQPQCHRATVAAFLARIILDGHAEAATQGRRAQADHDFLTGLRRVIEQWNYGFYTENLFRIEPPDLLTGVEEDFRTALVRLAEAQGCYAWPMPKDLFEVYDGRAPDPRPAWSLEEGKLIAQPRISDYVHFLRLKPV